MRVNDLAMFIKRRESIREKKEAGKPRPWTVDAIFDNYRFCNVRREDDRVTRWLREQYYVRWMEDDNCGGWLPDKDIWFTAVVARLLNLPESLEAVANYVLPWKPEKFRAALHERKCAGKKNFNAAYIVSTNGIAMDKVDYIVQRVLGPLWVSRRKLRYNYETLKTWHEAFMKFDGLGSFIAAQVIADLKYMPPMDAASDWATFAASGPGSRRGLNRVIGNPVDAPWREYEWHNQLLKLRDKLLPLLPKPIHLHAQDVQNCLCEFDKYERARLGEGTPKQLYKEYV